jgi:hypothetical protein
VQQHSRPGDVIVDFDTIAVALGSPVTHGHGSAHWKAAIEARDAAITAAVTLAQNGTRAWIIDSRPTTAKRAWYTSHGARFASLTAPREELHRRATQAGRPADWHNRIDQYLDSGEPQPVPRTRW